MEKVTFLFLASSPSTPELEQELSQIEDAVKQSKYRDQFDDINFKLIGTLDDFGAYITQERPVIFHFSGHGHSDGELKVGEQYVPNDFLAKLFTEVGKDVQCVILNGCYSEKQAHQIAKSVPCVVGTKRAVRHPTAIKFAREFYKWVGNGTDGNTAFQRARDFVMADDVRISDHPDYFALLPTEGSGKDLIFVPVSMGPTLINTLNKAQLQGEEGDQHTGSFYRYNVWLDNVSLEAYRHFVEQDKSFQQYTLKGDWHSHVYKEINLLGVRVDTPWGDEAEPGSQFSLIIKVVDGKLDDDMQINIDRHDDERNNYAASKVEQLIRWKIDEIMR